MWYFLLFSGVLFAIIEHGQAKKPLTYKTTVDRVEDISSFMGNVTTTILVAHSEPNQTLQ